MGSVRIGPIAVRRPRWRAYLLLARISNLPTVWTNVLAGLVAAQQGLHWESFVHVAGAMSLFYCGGMFLNDAFDAAFDAHRRPERPIPSGDVTRREAFTLGSAMIVAGELLLAPDSLALLLGVALAVAIATYDYRHKASRVAPVIMGACRALVYCVAAAFGGRLSSFALAGGLVMGAYIVGLTLVARRSGAAARWSVPLLLAGISLVDAAFIAVVSRSLALAVVAASAFLVTLALQRLVPGD